MQDGDGVLDAQSATYSPTPAELLSGVVSVMFSSSPAQRTVDWRQIRVSPNFVEG